MADTQHHELSIFADYHQFYLQDEAADGNLSDCWTDEAVRRLLALTDGTIGVGTVDNNDVDVTIDILSSAPALDLDAWEHVTECSLAVPSGKIVVAGCTDYFPDARRIAVTPGVYRARISLISPVSENLGADVRERCRIQLWQSSEAGV